jgi:recombination associated protein RdgC
MWFKNLQIYRLPAPWAMTAEQLAGFLAPQAFTPCTSIQLQSQGWIPPRPDGDLVHTVNRQMLLSLATEKKLLPSSVINQVAKARAVEMEEQQGFRPGRKQMKELKAGRRSAGRFHGRPGHRTARHRRRQGHRALCAPHAGSS